MLTADLVRARRRGDRLSLLKLEGPALEAALGLARRYLGIATACVGEARETFKLACQGVAVTARHRRLADGLLKLVKDRCEFEAEAGLDPAALRRAVFERAAASRRGGSFDRRAVLSEAGQAFGEHHGEHDDAVVTADDAVLTAEEVERLLYADLRAAHRLIRVEPTSAEALVEAYQLGQAQAVLLRASRVTVDLSCSSPAAFRRLFHRMKFLRLLFAAERLGKGRYRLVIDGPLSLFSAVTRYGLQLALMLPLLRETEHFELSADVHWGKDRMPLRFELAGGEGAAPKGRRPKTALPDEVEVLLGRFAKRKTDWRAARCAEIFALPGVGLCVPDLVFTRGTGKGCEKIYLEVLGYWSREAVWKRVELVEAGLKQKLIFAVSSRLRVSEAALDEQLPGALYVYKGALQAAAIEDKLEQLAG